MKDQYLRSNPTEHSKLNENHSLPPIRSQKVVSDHQPTMINRIQSSEYDKWDKYDAGNKWKLFRKSRFIKQTVNVFDTDTECLKIDLKEEQNREQSLMKDKREQSAKIIEIVPKVILTEAEKYEFAEKYVWKMNHLITARLYIIKWHFQASSQRKWIFQMWWLCTSSARIHEQHQPSSYRRFLQQSSFNL